MHGDDGMDGMDNTQNGIETNEYVTDGDGDEGMDDTQNGIRKNEVAADGDGDECGGYFVIGVLPFVLLCQFQTGIFVACNYE